jgi:rhodanese-related sulfurtransferase
MRRMTASQLAEHLEDANPLLLDVREPWEFEICHIVGIAITVFAASTSSSSCSSKMTAR